MITVSITVAALVATSIMGYLAIHYKNKAKDNAAKFAATKIFADSAATKILRLESDNKAMANKIVTLTSELTIAKEVKAKPVLATTPTESQKPNKPKRRFYKAKKENNN